MLRNGDQLVGQNQIGRRLCRRDHRVYDVEVRQRRTDQGALPLAYLFHGVCAVRFLSTTHAVAHQQLYAPMAERAPGAKRVALAALCVAQGVQSALRFGHEHDFFQIQYYFSSQNNMHGKGRGDTRGAAPDPVQGPFGKDPWKSPKPFNRGRVWASQI